MTIVDKMLEKSNQPTSQPLYSYSLQAIEFIVEEIKKDPENIIQNLKEKVKK